MGQAGNHTEDLEVSLLDLVGIFEEEAERLCASDDEARILAASALRDFLNTYGKGVIVE